MADVSSHRWTDKPLAQLALWGLRTAALLTCAGVGWLIRTAIAAESTNARQDTSILQQQAQIEALKEQEKQDRREILDELKEIKADVKAMRK